LEDTKELIRRLYIEGQAITMAKRKGTEIISEGRLRTKIPTMPAYVEY
jgi:hypothetical protein